MTDRYYRNSLALLERARRVTPGGTQTRSKMASGFVEGAFPAFARGGSGAHITDVDGHEYIDWIMGLAAVGLGYGRLRLSLIEAPSLSLPTELEVEVAEQLTEIIPCAQDGMIRFVKTGSEATEGAMRIARLATGRDAIISIGYHGWHSVHDAAKPEHPGVPRGFANAMREAPYNDLDVVRSLLQAEHTAAVLLEPVLIDPPAPEYLEGVRDLCTRHGALLIFDEVVTGFRWALGGAGEYFGVMPDLACFGKAMANGYPLACVAGRRDLMDPHGTYISSTFGGERVSLAAAKATIETYRREPVIRHLWDIGRALIDGFNAWAVASSSPFRMEGYAVHPRIVATAADPETRRLLMSLFLQETAARSILFHPAGLNPSYSHTQEDVTRTLLACAETMRVCVEASASPDGIAVALRGAPIIEAFKRVAERGGRTMTEPSAEAREQAMAVALSCAHGRWVGDAQFGVCIVCLARALAEKDAKLDEAERERDEAKDSWRKAADDRDAAQMERNSLEAELAEADVLEARRERERWRDRCKRVSALEANLAAMRSTAREMVEALGRAESVMDDHDRLHREPDGGGPACGLEFPQTLDWFRALLARPEVQELQR